jgi:hypothetical protein
MVPSAAALRTVHGWVRVYCSATCRGLREARLDRIDRQFSPTSNLALRDDLMFDQSHIPPRTKESLW